MNVLGALALAFILVPILELVVLIRLGQFMGLWPTVALVLASGIIGSWLAKLEGMRIVARFQNEVAAGRIPTREMLDGMSVMVGGVLLLTPGLLTDVMGLALLFPPTRRAIQWWVSKRLEKGIASGSIRVVTMDGSGFGAQGGWQDPRTRAGAPPIARPGGLDPSKNIVIEPDE